MMMMTAVSYPLQPTPELVEALVADYGRLVSAVCFRMLQDPRSAEDAAQEVWIEVLKSLPSFEGRSKLSTWIYTIAYRVVSRFARDERVYSTRFLSDFFRDETHELPQPADADREQWVKEMCDKCLTGILHCLDSETRLAYIFRDMAQLSFDELAQIFEKDPQALRQIVSRARKKLRRFLNDECALFNPQGSCHCRMRRWVDEIELPAEYQRLRRTVHRLNLYRESETILPRKNYWEKYL